MSLFPLILILLLIDVLVSTRRLSYRTDMLMWGLIIGYFGSQALSSLTISLKEIQNITGLHIVWMLCLAVGTYAFVQCWRIARQDDKYDDLLLKATTKPANEDGQTNH